MPVYTLQLIEKANRGFVWGDSEAISKMHTISRSKVCQTKNRGGFGWRSMKDTNLIGLAKAARCLLWNPNQLGLEYFSVNMGVFVILIWVGPSKLRHALGEVC